MNSQIHGSRLDTNRSGLRRKGASEIGDVHWSRGLSGFTGGGWIWVTWGLALIAVSISFALLYYFRQVNVWRDSIVNSVATSAAVLSYDYFLPLWTASDSFNASMNSGGIVGLGDYSTASSLGYPLFKQFPHLEQVELYFGSDIMRLRPSVGSLRVDACDNKYPSEALGYQLTNLLDLPVIYAPVGNADCADDQNYCKYGLACETESSEAALVNETLNGAFLYVPPEEATVTLDSLRVSYSWFFNATYAVRSVIELAGLTTSLSGLYADYRLIVIDSDGNGIASSQPTYYQPFSIVVSPNKTATLKLNTDIYSLDPVLYPWVSLLPALASLPGLEYPYSVYDSTQSWGVQIAKVDAAGSFYVVLASKRSDFTYGLVYGLGIAIISIAAAPMAVFTLVMLYRLLRALTPKRQVTNLW